MCKVCFFLLSMIVTGLIATGFMLFARVAEPLPEDEWDGPVGFIYPVAHNLYLSQHEDPAEIEYYLCGPPMMLRAVEKMLDSLGWIG